jgi:hypothetical protein
MPCYLRLFPRLETAEFDLQEALQYNMVRQMTFSNLVNTAELLAVPSSTPSARL